MRITYSESVSVASVIQHAKRMGRIILSPVASPSVPHFFTSSPKGHDLRGKKKLIEIFLKQLSF
jgi:hypothetical protein